jgi:hypothetical protein
VVVSGDRIVDAGPASKITVPKNTKTIDARGDPKGKLRLLSNAPCYKSRTVPFLDGLKEVKTSVKKKITTVRSSPDGMIALQQLCS